MKQSSKLAASIALAAVLATGAVHGAPALAAPQASGATTTTTTAPSTPVRVLTLGDSITYGLGSGTATSYTGYRGPLQTLLKADPGAKSYDFVGSVKRGTKPVDPDNSGHSGWRIEQINAYAKSWVTAAKPNVVLLHIGTNDMNQAYRLTTAPDRLDTLINTIRAAAPTGVKIVVAKIVPSPSALVQARIATYNQGVTAVAARQAALHGDTTLVDMSTALTPTYATDFADYLHPNDRGYARMAAVWHTGMLSLG